MQPVATITDAEILQIARLLAQIAAVDLQNYLVAADLEFVSDTALQIGNIVSPKLRIANLVGDDLTACAMSDTEFAVENPSPDAWLRAAQAWECASMLATSGNDENAILLAAIAAATAARVAKTVIGDQP